MDRKLKRWEMALMLGLLCALVGGSWLGQEQHELADSVIRFHVIANSDSAQDQALKLAVRDRVLEEAQAVYPSNATLESARSALESSLTQLADAGRQVVEEQGYDYPVSAQLTQCWFPTKEYDGFALPAGNYTALRVVIGEGEGQNWWCVAFPPLCLGGGQRNRRYRRTGWLFQSGPGQTSHRRERGLCAKIQGYGAAGTTGSLFQLVRNHILEKETKSGL